MIDALHPALAQARQADVVRGLPRRRRLRELRARRRRDRLQRAGAEVSPSTGRPSAATAAGSAGAPRKLLLPGDVTG